MKETFDKHAQMRDAGLFERESSPSSPLRLALLVAVVIAILGGATALMEDSAVVPSASAARAIQR